MSNRLRLESLRETPLPSSPGSPTLNLTPVPSPKRDDLPSSPTLNLTPVPFTQPPAPSPQPPGLLRAPTLDLTTPSPLPEDPGCEGEEEEKSNGDCDVVSDVEEEEKSKKEEGSKRIDRKPETAEELIGELRRRLEATGPPPPPVRVRTLVPFKIKGMTVDSIIAVHGLSEKIPDDRRMIVTWDRTEEKKWDLPSASVHDGAPTVEILDWQ